MCVSKKAKELVGTRSLPFSCKTLSGGRSASPEELGREEVSSAVRVRGACPERRCWQDCRQTSGHPHGPCRSRLRGAGWVHQHPQRESWHGHGSPRTWQRGDRLQQVLWKRRRSPGRGARAAARANSMCLTWEVPEEKGNVRTRDVTTAVNRLHYALTM